MQTPSLHIVIVEDDLSIRDLFLEALSAHKIKTDILVFENGLQLINYVKKSMTSIPDLVFFKLHLPMQNGLRCVKAMRSLILLNNAILVIYSPEATEAQIEEAFIERANIYMETPREQDQLEENLEEILKLAFQYKHSNLSVENLLLRL